jgi:hypothetical protein
VSLGNFFFLSFFLLDWRDLISRVGGILCSQAGQEYVQNRSLGPVRGLRDACERAGSVLPETCRRMVDMVLRRHVIMLDAINLLLSQV